jgi:hypothetical protein
MTGPHRELGAILADLEKAWRAHREQGGYCAELIADLGAEQAAALAHEFAYRRSRPDFAERMAAGRRKVAGMVAEWLAAREACTDEDGPGMMTA